MSVEIEAPEQSTRALLVQFEQELTLFDSPDVSAEFEEPTEEELKDAEALATSAEEETEERPPDEDAPDTSDPLDLYLAELRHITFLTRPEKKYHMDRFTRGREALIELRTVRKLSKRVYELQQDIDSGWESRNLLITTHLPLVVSIAKKYRFRGVPLGDLINSGNIGLMRALYKFKPKTGNALSTYATFWIRQAVLKEISDSSRTIHMAENTENDVAQMVFIQNTFMSKFQRNPTENEIAKRMKKKVTRVRELRGQMKEPLSIEHPVADAQDDELGDYLEETDSEPTEFRLGRRAMLATFNEVFAELSHDEQKALRIQYGSPNNKRIPITEIAAAMRISVYLAGELLKSARTKIKKHPKAYLLQEYIQ